MLAALRHAVKPTRLIDSSPTSSNQTMSFCFGILDRALQQRATDAAAAKRGSTSAAQQQALDSPIRIGNWRSIVVQACYHAR